MAKIDKLQERLRKLEEQLEREKEETHKSLGEELVKQLGLDYDLLGTKKEIKTTVELLVSELKSNPFSSELEEDKVVLDSDDSVENNEYVSKQY